MVRAYSLYFDVPPSDWERRRRTIVLACVIAAHLFILGWALRTLPPIVKDRSSIVVVMLTDALTRTTLNPGHRADLAKNTATKPGLTAGKPAKRQQTDTLRVADAARPPVADGRLARADGDSSSSSAAVAAALAANAGGNAASTGKSTGRSGASSTWPFIPPRVTHRWKPPYPAEAYAANREGESEVLVTIAADGQLKEASISQSSGSVSLDEAALDAVRRYSYSAAEKGGNPIEAQAIVVVEWTIRPSIEVTTASGLTRSR